jgi:excisionase family DNA binding protein
MTKHLYRIAEAAEALGRSRSRIYELIADGVLEAVKDGRSTLVTAESMHDFVGGLRADAGVTSPFAETSEVRGAT